MLPRTSPPLWTLLSCEADLAVPRVPSHPATAAGSRATFLAPEVHDAMALDFPASSSRTLHHLRPPDPPDGNARSQRHVLVTAAVAVLGDMMIPTCLALP